MSNSKLSPKEQEELNKLENEAFKELGQIIAIAYQVQDIEYINNLILAWERKYQKLLSNPDFKKKFKKILDEAYDEVVKYILSRIRLKEEQVIKNQRKALNELYNIIKDNSDLDTLKAKIKKWEGKYPYDSFLKMYQKRIDSAKREKNLQENAFNQEEAFKDLYYGVVNRSGTIEELQEYLKKWEDKYSINNNFTIDDFIKHQSEVKRYTSNEFLVSIAKKEDNILDNVAYNLSDSTQDSAYKQLKSIISSKNNIDEVFKWVYQNHSIKFNDKYKELILRDINLDYSPKYLKSLSLPDIDLTKPTLSIEQYKQINEIKRYAVISYFNLLLPPNQAIYNYYFINHINTIYSQIESQKHNNIINTFEDEVSNFTPEIVKEKKETDLEADSIHLLTREKPSTTLDIESNVLDIEKLISDEENPHTIEIVTHSETIEPVIDNSTNSQPDIKDFSIEDSTVLETENLSSNAKPVEDYQIETINFTVLDNNEIHTTEFVTIDSDETEKSDINSITVSKVEDDLVEEKPMVDEASISAYPTDISTPDSPIEDSKPSVDYDTIISVSPVFFETINNYSIQATLVQTVADKADEKSKENLSIDISNTNTKTRNQSE